LNPSLEIFDQARRWLAPILLICASFFAADLTAAKLEQGLSVAAPLSSPSPRVVGSTGNNVTSLLNPGELQAVLENTARHSPTLATSNTTGGPRPLVAPTPGAPPAANQAALPKLTGTIAGAGHSLAILQSGDDTRVCGINETMNGYTVVEVSQFSALLRDSQGQDHRLSLDLAAATQAPAPPPPAPALNVTISPTPRVMQVATPPADNTISRSQIKEYMDHFQDWIGNVNVRPLKKGEDIIGVQINYNKPDNPFFKLGVSSGDVLTDLNGHPLKGPEDLQWAYGELRNNTQFDFQIERGGKPTQFTVHLADN
jgi:type II secretion system protein C